MCADHCQPCHRQETSGNAAFEEAERVSTMLFMADKSIFHAFTLRFRLAPEGPMRNDFRDSPIFGVNAGVDQPVCISFVQDSESLPKYTSRLFTNLMNLFWLPFSARKRCSMLSCPDHKA